MDRQLLVFNSRDEMLRIDVSSIVYFEADGNYTYIVTCNKLKSDVCMNLGQMEDVLAQRLKEKKSIFCPHRQEVHRQLGICVQDQSAQEAIGLDGLY